MEQDEATTTQTPSKEELEPRESKDFSLSPPPRGWPLFFSLPLPGEGEGTWLGGRKGRADSSRAFLGAVFPLSHPNFCCKRTPNEPISPPPSPRLHPDQRQAAHVGQEAGKSGGGTHGRIESDLIQIESGA